jgi:membrane fusion protein, multidrug efflux system
MRHTMADDMLTNRTSTEAARKRRGIGGLFGYLAGGLMIAGACYAVYSIWHTQDHQLSVTRQALAETAARGPRVDVVPVSQGPTERPLTLLGDTRAFQTATLYAKISGYLKSIAVDRGDLVTAGQVLAEIESDEYDSQLQSAVTDLANKRKNAARAHSLVTTGFMSQQATEQADTDYRMAEARVSELATMKSYEQIRAPFDGRITARFVDPGALVQNSTTNQTSNQPVVTLIDDRKLRVDVYVEQRDAPLVRVGDQADVSDGTDPTRKIRATIARTSGALDPKTRTLFVELEVDNSAHFLVPGSFAYVTLHLPEPGYPAVPVGGLIVRGVTTYVAAVGDDGLVNLRTVKVASTDGTMASIASGVKVGDRVAVNLPDEIADGARIQPVLASR